MEIAMSSTIFALPAIPMLIEEVTWFASGKRCGTGADDTQQ